jgi:diguanylate cyclase (GGDEF)-like protein
MTSFAPDDAAAFVQRMLVMLRPRPSIGELSAIADAVARATDLQAAFDTLITEVSGMLRTRVCIVQRIDRGWVLIAQTRGGLRVPISDLHLALGSVSSDDLTAPVDLQSSGEGIWTAISLKDPDGPSMVMLLADNWTILDDTLNPFALLLSFALRSVRAREVRRHAERLIGDGYTMARRLSRLGPLDIVCQRIVEQVSRTLEADRVALALYRPEEDRLAIVATHGYPASAVKDVRIEPGSWVIGHVYTSGRPVAVPDIRQIPGMSLERLQYRTFSFAAVPMFAGTETVGVLSATDKRDGSTFDRQDTVALRTFSAFASLALMAARSDTEVHRLAYAATVDSLTGLFNRPYLDARLHQEVERARRGLSSLTVLMADIDDFKTINDTYGHQVGDAVLQAVGGILRSAVRVFDVCSRYGGDEFAILMPSSDQSSAAACAERIRLRVSEHGAGTEGRSHLPRLTMSIGVAVIETGDAPADLIGRADRRLYLAKAEGKNRVRASSDPSDISPQAPIDPSKDELS